MAKLRLDTLLAQRGLFASRARAAASVMAGEVRLGGSGGDGPPSPASSSPRTSSWPSTSARASSRAGGSSSPTRWRRRHRPRRAPLPGRRRLDRRLHRLPAAARRGARRRLDVAYGELDWSLRTDERVTVLERTNARSLAAGDLPYAPDLVVADVSFISLTKVLPAVLACCAERFDALAMVKPQFEVGRERVGKGGVVRSPEDRRAALVAVAGGRPRARRRGARLRVLGPARARRATARRSCGWPRPGAPGRDADLEAARRARSSRDRPRAHGHRALPRAPRADRRGAARAHRGRPSARASLLRFDAEETRKYGLKPRDGLVLDAPLSDDVELCVSLGGDGTILRALRRYAGTSVPGLRRQLRRGRLPGHHRPRRRRRRPRPSSARWPATSRC